MNEMTKMRTRLQREGVFDRYINGSVLDVGCGEDKVTPEARGWDKSDGDAQTLEGLEDESFQTVVSGHCLEHLRDPHEGLFNWWRVLKPGGYLVVQIPHESLYEQGIVPSIFNPDHKATYSISTDKSWSPRSINVFDLLSRLPNRNVIYVKTVDTGYDYSKMGYQPIVDQTLGDAEAAIEFVVQKMDVRLALRSALKQLVVCPNPDCQRMSVTLNGFTQDDKMSVRCTDCGFSGDMGWGPSGV